MSVGYSDLFHRAFSSMVFPVDWFPAPDALRPPEGFAPVGRACNAEPRAWPSEDAALGEALMDHCLGRLEALLEAQAERTAAIVIEPGVQGAAGMVVQPPGFARRVRELADRYGVLLIADEVAVGFGRTGRMFALEHELAGGRGPDILCLAKGLTAGYLPLAVTMTTDAIEDAFTGTPEQRRTLYHGHTYTGNPLACAVALASLELFDQPFDGCPDLLSHARAGAELIRQRLDPLRDCAHVRDVRQRGLMVGIELGPNPRFRADPGPAEPFDFAQPRGHSLCAKLREQGILIRPLGNVLVLMPILATPKQVLADLADRVVDVVVQHRV
jgi:adenosylmethionine-8-amino-7-oxononanoate aminotransferase